MMTLVTVLAGQWCGQDGSQRVCVCNSQSLNRQLALCCLCSWTYSHQHRATVHM